MGQRQNIHGTIKIATDLSAIACENTPNPLTTFQSGLFALLGNPNGQPAQGSSPRDMATHARIFYYAQRLGVTIDFTAYQTWLSQHPDHQAPDILPDSYLARHSDSRSQDAAAAAESSASLPWQQAAPKNDLFIDKKAAAAGQSQEDQPSYPMAFAEMLKLLQEGKPVPGIRQIPNTVVRDPVSASLPSILSPCSM